MSKIDYQRELNPAQMEAVLSTTGPHLIIAGAGSGKTRVLVYRTAYLVEQGTPPDRILLLTFTRKAAAEMLKRATQLLDDRCEKVAGGTFHSFANATLRKHAAAVGLARNFTILDQTDAENVIQLVRKQLGFHKLDKKFPRKQALLSLISKSVNKSVDVESVIYEEYPHFSSWKEQILQIQEEYGKYKKAQSLLDYDDLLLYLKELLKSQPALCRRLSEQYQYIMVDEYQDTNKIQADIVRLLTAAHKNVMVVGDDAQSIYSFRGAHFRNIIDFPNTFPGAKVILLEENYRSSQPILDLTNEVILSAGEKFEKSLFTNKPGENMPVFVDVYDENSQSKYIVKKIADLRREGVPLNEIAILFRSGWHSNDLEVELASWGISFLKYGGQKFVEAAHIKDVMSYLNVLQNPRHEVSWLRILTLMKGVGPRTASQIVAQLIQHQDWDIDEKLLKKNDTLEKLFAIFKQLDARKQTPQELLKDILGFYYPFLMEQYDDYDKRMNDLDSLEKIAARYSGLEEFIADMALEPPEKSIVDKGFKNRGDNLVLSTIHSAKGLEWHTVFLIYVAEGYLPSYRSMDSYEAIEEERRLFYVATSRAKEHLYLLRPQREGIRRDQEQSWGYTRVSRFLGEGEILKKLVIHQNMGSDDTSARAGRREWASDYQRGSYGLDEQF